MAGRIQVSCIVLCTFNDLFVRDRAIPGIRSSSDAATTEILVVDNGPGQDLRLDDVPVIRSEPYHIPRGYNAGVAAARGEFVALFHDDCELRDPRWVQKCLAALDDVTWAVGPDLRVRSSYAYLKEVPLVMRRDAFLGLGGYDETHYLGYQADLLCMAMLDRGKRVAHVDLDCTHFCIPGKSIGMSTLLLLSPAGERDALRKAFASPSFSLRDMEALVDAPENALRAQYFFRYLIQEPASIYLDARYAGTPEQARPRPDRLVRDGVLPAMMPRTREEMQKLVLILEYYNELFERVHRIP